MVTITDKAKERISTIMQQENYDSNYFVRVAVESGGCSGLSYKLNFDNEEKKGDQFFDVDYPLPAELAKEKLLTVKFAAKEKSTEIAIFFLC